MGCCQTAVVAFETERGFMVGSKFAILGCCALYFLCAQAERAYTPAFDASALLPRNTVLPPAAVPVRTSPPEKPFVTEAHKKNFRDFLSMRLSLPARFISWSHHVKAFVGMSTLQKNCLTTAVYFESRSESAVGQLAVAMVVLNRAQASNSSVCGVVYKGAERFNACQFSFACDGKPDIVDDTRAWKTSMAITHLALADKFPALSESLQVLSIATNYHADYVNPKWSKQLTRLAKIGRHIFYSERPVIELAGSRKNYI